jgi:hypothetical protein
MLPASYLEHTGAATQALTLAARLLARTPFFADTDEAASFLADVAGLYAASPSALPRSLALQQAAAREFSLALPETPASAAAVTGALMRRLGPRLQVALRAFSALAHADLASWNLPGLVVYRGLPETPPELRAGLRAGYADVSLAPVSSWTAHRPTAERRAGRHGLVLAALAPRERVLSCASLGLGDPEAQEVVVLGGAGTVRLFSADLLPAAPSGADDESESA